MKILTRTNDHIILEDGTEIETVNLEDGEVVALDNDDTVVQWDNENKMLYNSGETLDEFGRDNLFTHEINRVS